MDSVDDENMVVLAALIVISVITAVVMWQCRQPVRASEPIVPGPRV